MHIQDFMSSRIQSRFCFLVPILLLSATAFGQFSFQPLGFLPGEVESDATAVSADGRVVVGRSPDPRRSFVWIASAGMLELRPASGYDSCAALGVSMDGSWVCGYSSISSNGLQTSVRWQPSNGLRDLGSFGGYPDSGASAISADGNGIVGSGFGNGRRQAYRWTQSTGFTGLGFLAGDDSSDAYGSSVDGSVVVGRSVVGANGGLHAFRWTQNGMAQLPDRAQATAVSGDGNIICGTAYDVMGYYHAVRWNNGVISQLPSLSGTFSSAASAISLDGSVIGGQAVGDSSQTAFFWTERLGTIELKSYLEFPGVQIPAGWSLSGIRGVSADGRSVVGEGRYPGGGSNQQAFLANLRYDYALLTPNDFTVFRGNYESGGLDELAQSDERYLVVRNGVTALRTESPITVIFYGTAPVDRPWQIKLSMENHVSITGLIQRVDMFNFILNTYQQMDQRTATRRLLPVRAEPGRDAEVALPDGRTRLLLAGDRGGRDRLRRVKGPLLVRLQRPPRGASILIHGVSEESWNQAASATSSRATIAMWSSATASPRCEPSRRSR